MWTKEMQTKFEEASFGNKDFEFALKMFHDRRSKDVKKLTSGWTYKGLAEFFGYSV